MKDKKTTLRFAMKLELAFSDKRVTTQFLSFNGRSAPVHLLHCLTRYTTLTFRGTYLISRACTQGKKDLFAFIFAHKTPVKFTSNKCYFELTVFELTINFKHEMIGIWQRFQRNFELSGTSN